MMKTKPVAKKIVARKSIVTLDEKLLALVSGGSGDATCDYTSLNGNGSGGGYGGGGTRRRVRRRRR